MNEVSTAAVRPPASLPQNSQFRRLFGAPHNRNYWKFVGSAPASVRAAVHDTITGTYRHLGVDPFAYLRDVLPALHALGNTPTPERLGRLLPDAWVSQRPSTHPHAQPAA